MGRVLKYVVVLAAAAIAVLPLPRGSVERMYARGAYPLIQPRLTSLTNRTPVAWFDVMVLVVACAVVAMWIARLRRLVRRSHPGEGGRRTGALQTIGGLTVDTTAIAAVIYFWFLIAWGLNYRREPLSAQLDFREDRITQEALRDLALRNIESLNALHKNAHAAGWPELRAVPGLLAPAFLRAQRDLAMTWQAEPGLPKRSLLNFYFTRVSIDGMTDPFFLETLTNQSLLPFERPATVAHEWGHLAGYADESEANFLGWLVCMRGSAPERYSGWLSLYGTVMNSLPRADREELSRALDEGPREDLRAIAERIQRQVLPMASRAGYALYDRFLKANRVEAGIRSYSEVVRLLLGTRFTQDGRPILREP
jgi:Protein of unknown function (DUF3810)